MTALEARAAQLYNRHNSVLAALQHAVMTYQAEDPLNRVIRLSSLAERTSKLYHAAVVAVPNLGD